MILVIALMGVMNLEPQHAIFTSTVNLNTDISRLCYFLCIEGFLD